MARISVAIAPKIRATSIDEIEVASIDEIVAALAAQQHFVVSRQQLLRAGATSEAIRHQLAVGRWCQIHAGVYAIGPPSRLTRDGRYMAAVLACGQGAVLSHRSAAALWGLRPTPAGPIDVTVPRRGTRRRSGIAVHTSRSLEQNEIAARRFVPCTTVARTMLDIARTATSRELDRAIERSQILQLYDHRDLEAVLERASGRRGAERLRRRLEHLADEPPPSRSELERRFLELVRRVGLPIPIVNGLVGGYEVDFHWPRERLIVETDGRSFHSTSVAFQRDRRRDLDLELAGWHVLRIGWRQLVACPDRVLAVLASRLSEPLAPVAFDEAR